MIFENNTDISYSKKALVLDDINEDLASEISYGLEYILDEIFPEKKLEIIQEHSIDWFGLTDLML